MRSTTILIALGLLAFVPSARAQEDLFNHLYWSGKGSHAGQQFGSGGLDTIGYLNSEIQHAFALGEDGASYLVFNRFPGDTDRQYRFPGQKVIRGNMNGDAYPDFVCWDKTAQKITVLFGKASLTRFDTALVLQGTSDYYKFLDGKIVVTDCDGDMIDDLVISDGQFRDSVRQYIGRIQFFKGGQTMSPTPTLFITGVSPQKDVGGLLCVGNIHEKQTRQLIELRFPSPFPDSMAVREYSLDPGFTLIPIDTFVCNVAMGGIASVQCMDIDGDSIQDLVIGDADRVLMLKGGDHIPRTPTFIFHKPISTGSGTYGSKVVDIGDASGHGYHSIIVNDPDASSGGLGNGVINLFNIGRGLKDAYTAYGLGDQSMAAFGSQIIPLGDLDHDGRCEFAVASGDDSDGAGGLAELVGALFIFGGDQSYGPVVSVREDETLRRGLEVLENYPNPFSKNTIIRWTTNEPESRTILTVSDMLGREVERMYDGRSGSPTNYIPFSAGQLQSGSYLLRIFSGMHTSSTIMQVIK